jgi:NAD(P)H-hydrate repair Nnr-like enzyme with NAD(P)H-hydrate dehydratase domain
VANRSVGVVVLSMALQIVRFTWEDVAPLVQSVVPPLSSFDHKGSMGRIGVIGGSIEHCGAPYYATISAIKLGADLAWVYCSQAAAVPVKAYSPELIVIPFYDDKVGVEIIREIC